MKYIVNSSIDPHYNMAFDEALLGRPVASEPVFRLWQNRPSVIIGLNQSAYAEVNLPYLEQNGITLARRVTGGGAVYHDLGNLNYTITGRIGELDEQACLQQVVDALKSLGVPAERTGRNDIMVEDRKCSGYAKRMEKDGVDFKSVRQMKKWMKEHEAELKAEQNGDVPKVETYVHEGPRIGRNDPCPCGSGKKYKKCCGKDL